MDSSESKIREAMELMKNLRFTWYQKRLDEIATFSAHASSNTASNLIDTAKALTSLSYKEWDLLRNEAMSLIGASISDYQLACEKENRSLENAHKKVMDAAVGEGDLAERKVEVQKWSNEILRNLEDSASNKELLSDRVFVVTSAFVDMSSSLLHETYKPKYQEFHKESARSLLVSALKKIGWLSVLDDIEELRKIDPKYRLRSLLVSGDKALAYLEKYNEQATEWILAARTLQGEMRSAQ